MTLGGLALAVGILVDDATVEIENIHRNFGMNKPIRQAILDGASQIAVPAFVSTLAICIVFVPVLFLTGPAASLFYPAGAGGRLRHAGLVFPVADAGADDGALPAAARGPRSTPTATSTAARTGGGPIWRFHQALQPPVRALPSRLRGAAGLGAGPPRRHARGAARLRRWARWPWPRGSARTSSRPSMPASSGCTCGRRPARASRRPSASSARSRT